MSSMIVTVNMKIVKAIEIHVIDSMEGFLMEVVEAKAVETKFVETVEALLRLWRHCFGLLWSF